MNDEFRPPPRSWPQKFRHAFAGVRLGVRDQSSFSVHFVFVAMVIAGGVLLQVSRHEWCLLIICLAVVLAAETFNSALEHLARAVDRRENSYLAAGLDIGSGAVLVTAIGAAIVGAIIFLTRAGVLLGWWTGNS